MTGLAAAIRFAHLAAAVYLAGSYAFMVLIARPALRSAGGSAGATALLDLQIHRRAARWAIITVLASALAALWVQAIIISAPGAGDGLQALMPLLTQTQYGRVWQLRFALALVAAAAVLIAGKRRADPSVSAKPELVLSACLLGSLALYGHSAAAEGFEFALQVSADALHLLAAGAWLGGLVPLFLLLRRCQGSGDACAHQLLQGVVWRYSRMGIFCVALLMATGGLNAWLLVGGVPQLLGTPYGQLLVLKLALLLPLLGVAAVNLLRLNPGIAAAPVAPPGTWRSLSNKLARNAMLEAGVGLLMLAIVAVLGMTPPARHAQPGWPFAFRWDWSILDTSASVRAAIDAGLGWGVLGLFVLQFAFLSRHLRAWTITAGIALLGYAAAVIFAPVSTDAYPTTFRRPEVAYQAVSIFNGRQLYARDCAACHGQGGLGDGADGAALRPRPADLTASHANAHTAGDLYWWISNGVRDSAMPAFAARLAEEDRWDLVNYLRALSGGRKARELAAAIEDEAWLVAPDFTYTGANGEPRDLKEHRGKSLVLLVLLDQDHAAARLAQLDEAADRLKDAGVEVVAVPPNPRSDLRQAPLRLPVVIEGNREIHTSFALFAGNAAGKAADAAAAHVEYLIDKQGYIRARWLPAEGDAWPDPAAIAKQAELLSKEPPRGPAPEEHVH